MLSSLLLIIALTLVRFQLEITTHTILDQKRLLMDFIFIQHMAEDKELASQQYMVAMITLTGQR